MRFQYDQHNLGTERPLSSRVLAGAAAALGEYRTFLSTAVRNPRMTGAATPTSSAVAHTVAQVVPSTGRPVVVELGPGTGALSNGIRSRLPEGSRHIGIELNEELADHLRRHKPWMEVVHGDARELTILLDKLDVHQADAVITSVPWSLMEDRVQDDILRQATDALAPHGAFTALTYLPADRTTGGRRFRACLSRTFDEVLTCTTWRNLPPIMHYICRRPRS